jgi:hypothetical protein
MAKEFLLGISIRASILENSPRAFFSDLPQVQFGMGLARAKKLPAGHE